MKKFKIAIWVNKKGSPENGGSYTYPTELLSNIDKFNFDDRLEIVFTGFIDEHNFSKPFILLNDETHFFTRKITNFLHKFFGIKIKLADNLEKKKYPKNFELLNTQDVQLIFYPVNYIRYTDFPFIVNNWDLGHLSTYSFVEFTKTITDRETYYQQFKKALFICAESEAGKKELVNHLQLFDKKIKILPFFPGGMVQNLIVAQQPNFILPQEQYFFYPAAFGAHKNHYGLVQAFYKFSQKHPKVKLIFTGGDYINKVYIQDLVAELSLQNVVLFTGHVSNEVMKWLYINSLGLVMPTYLGPTNMPLLEAQALGCKVACSNLDGHIELLGNYAIYFNPENSEEIYNALQTLYEQRDQPKSKNNEEKYTIKNTINALNTIFLEAIPIRKTWGKK